MTNPPRRWLLLIHQVPPKPDYLRVKVRRRLQRIGAVALKSSVYVLPETDAAIEDFQWLLKEIVSDDGDATICTASFLAGISDDDIAALFRAQSGAQFTELAERARGVDSGTAALGDQVARLLRRFEAISAADFFSAPERRDAEQAIAALQHGVTEDPLPGPARAGDHTPPRGATWVTRKGVFIDRIASAWLIRRFIDPHARFRFVADADITQSDELRFDMYGGEFTHVGDRCTFETLLASFGLTEPALAAIAEIVHDIDCKDERFGRPETAGVFAVMQGIALETADDEGRLERGGLVLQGLYEQLRHSARTP